MTGGRKRKKQGYGFRQLGALVAYQANHGCNLGPDCRGEDTSQKRNHRVFGAKGFRSMSKQISSLLSLVAGIALLAVSAYWFIQIGKQRNLWGHGASAAETASLADQDAGAADASGYGVAAQSIDRISAGAVAKPGHFLHKKITIESYKTVEFELPAQMQHAALEGSYLCVTRKGVRDESGAAVELSLMNQMEYEKFSADEGTGSSTTQRPASHADIDWDLKDTYGNSRKYYLVFRNASRRPGATIVDADFEIKNSE
jgi:hypothetical protein